MALCLVCAREIYWMGPGEGIAYVMHVSSIAQKRNATKQPAGGGWNIEYRATCKKYSNFHYSYWSSCTFIHRHAYLHRRQGIRCQLAHKFVHSITSTCKIFCMHCFRVDLITWYMCPAAFNQNGLLFSRCIVSYFCIFFGYGMVITSRTR